MTLTDVGCGYYPSGLVALGNNGLEETVWHTFNAADRGRAVIFKVPETGDIIGGSITSNTVVTGETLTCEIWSMDGSGLPQSIATVGCTADVTFADTDDDTEKTFTFGMPHSATKVDVLAFVILSSSGWVSGDIDLMRTKQPQPITNMPYEATTTNGGASWSKAAGLPNSVGVEFSGNRWHQIGNALGYSGVSELTASGSTTEIAFQLTPTVDMRVTGLLGLIEPDTDATVEFYTTEAPGSGTQIGSIDSSFRFTTAERPHRVMFTAPQTLDAGTTYKFGFRRSSGAFRVSMLNYSAHQKKESVGIPYSQRTSWLVAVESSGAWDTSTYALYLPVIALIIDQLDDGAGGGGGGGSGLMVARRPSFY